MGAVSDFLSRKINELTRAKIKSVAINKRSTVPESFRLVKSMGICRMRKKILERNAELIALPDS